MKRKIIFIGIPVVLVLFGLLFVTHWHTPSKTQIASPSKNSTGSTKTTPGPATSSLTNLLNNTDNPSINRVSYTVTSTSQPVSGWLIAQVTAVNSYGTFKQIAILKQSPGSANPSVVAGPDTSFPLSYLTSIGVPQAVINQVPTYNAAQ